MLLTLRAEPGELGDAGTLQLSGRNSSSEHVLLGARTLPPDPWAPRPGPVPCQRHQQHQPVSSMGPSSSGPSRGMMQTMVLTRRGSWSYTLLPNLAWLTCQSAGSPSSLCLVGLFYSLPHWKRLGGGQGINKIFLRKTFS